MLEEVDEKDEKEQTVKLQGIKTKMNLKCQTLEKLHQWMIALCVFISLFTFSYILLTYTNITHVVTQNI